MTAMPPTPKKTNGMAITGFVLSFFCGILGIVFSAIGMSQTSKDPSQGGRGLAGIAMRAMQSGATCTAKPVAHGTCIHIQMPLINPQ